jgi:hypothetical protein
MLCDSLVVMALICAAAVQVQELIYQWHPWLFGDLAYKGER